MTAIRVGISVLVAFSVLAHGAVEVWSQAVLEIGAAALFLLWGVLIFRKRSLEIRWNPLCWPMLGFGGFVLLQWLFGLSVYPHLTKVECLKLAAYFLLFFLGVQAFRTAADARAFVWFLLIFGFAVAFFAILQFFAFNGKIYWFRELRHGGILFGPYVNHNHFAGLMELIAPLGLAILFHRAVQRDKLLFVGLFTIVAIGALFLSASRAGISSFLVQLGLLGILVRVQPRGRRRRLRGATLVVLLAGAFAVWLGAERVLERFGQLWSDDSSFETRMVISKDTGQIFLDHPWAGTGLGTLVTVYPQYASRYFEGKIVDHAHNDYVEAIAETGVAGSLCCLLFLVLLFRSGLSNLEADRRGSFALAVQSGALVACSGLLLHSLVDFNFHIPSNSLLFFLLAALVTMPGRQQKASLPSQAGFEEYLPTR